MTKDQARKTKSIELLYGLLNVADNNRIKYKRLINACKTQQDLANYHDLKLGIVSMSLNTFKHYANNCEKSHISFASIDLLRKEIKGISYDSNTNTNPQRLINEERNIDAKRLAVIYAYNDLLKIAKPLIINDDASLEDFQRHLERFVGVIGINEVERSG